MTQEDFLVLKCQLPQAAVEATEELLLATYAIAVSLADAKDHPLYEPEVNETPLWPICTLQAWIKPNIAKHDVEAMLRKHISSLGASAIRWSLASDELAHSPAQLDPPLSLGNRLNVYQDGPDSSRQFSAQIRIPAGLAFGTGHHQTTKSCLAWLCRQPLQGKHILDFGCGSGILAIAALALGAERASALDIDPQAELSTLENAVINGVDAQLSMTKQNSLKDAEFDVVFANILANPLESLAPVLAACCKPGGQIVLSGILASQIEKIVQAYRKYSDLIEINQTDDWARIVMRRAV